MESCSHSKVELIKPILLKAGIPLAFSVAGFLCAKFISSRRTLLHYDHDSTIDSDSETLSGIDQEENELRLINRIEELEKKEYEMEMKFVQCYVLKQHDIAYVEYLNEEISIMEMEDKKNKGFENLAVELYGFMQQLESKNVFLERKVNKLLRKLEGQSKLIGENNLKIEAIETQILIRHDEMETSFIVAMVKLEDEIKELQTKLLMNNLNAGKNCPPSISKVMDETEELGNYGVSDYSEVIYLRRSNAFLRHELMRKSEQEEDVESCLALEFDKSEELTDCSIEQQIEGMALEPVINSNTCSKRRKLFRKLKKWVDGTEKMDDDKVKCFGRHSETEKGKIHIF